MQIKINSILIDEMDKALEHTEVLSFIKKECMNKVKINDKSK
jgi:hypothetical protein